MKGSRLPGAVGSVPSLQDPARPTSGQLRFPARSSGAGGLTSCGESLCPLAVNYGYCAGILECKLIKIITFRWALGHIAFVVRAACCRLCSLKHLRASHGASGHQHQLLLPSDPFCGAHRGLPEAPFWSGRSHHRLLLTHCGHFGGTRGRR